MVKARTPLHPGRTANQRVLPCLVPPSKEALRSALPSPDEAPQSRPGGRRRRGRLGARCSREVGVRVGTGEGHGARGHLPVLLKQTESRVEKGEEPDWYYRGRQDVGGQRWHLLAIVGARRATAGLYQAARTFKLGALLVLVPVIVLHRMERDPCMHKRATEATHRKVRSEAQGARPINCPHEEAQSTHRREVEHDRRGVRVCRAGGGDARGANDGGVDD